MVSQLVSLVGCVLQAVAAAEMAVMTRICKYFGFSSCAGFPALDLMPSGNPVPH